MTSNAAWTATRLLLTGVVVAAGWGALIAIGLAAFTLQWLMDERPPRVRRPAGEPAAVPA